MSKIGQIVPEISLLEWSSPVKNNSFHAIAIGDESIISHLSAKLKVLMRWKTLLNMSTYFSSFMAKIYILKISIHPWRQIAICWTTFLRSPKLLQSWQKSVFIASRCEKAELFNKKNSQISKMSDFVFYLSNSIISSSRILINFYISNLIYC